MRKHLVHGQLLLLYSSNTFPSVHSASTGTIHTVWGAIRTHGCGALKKVHRSAATRMCSTTILAFFILNFVFNIFLSKEKLPTNLFIYIIFSTFLNCITNQHFAKSEWSCFSLRDRKGKTTYIYICLYY